MALSANTSLTKRNDEGKRRYTYTVKTSSIIYQDALVAIDISAGTILPAANATTTKFAGIAAVAFDGEFPVTGDGTKRVTVETDLEVLIPLKTSVTQGHTHGIMYAADDEDATNENTLGPQIGTLVEFVAANSGWVALSAPVMAAAS
jgi:hypothetical protein